MPCSKLKQYLDSHEIQYQLISHPTTYTAQLTASSSHVPPEILAKTVMFIMDGKLAMAVVAASRRVDLMALHGSIGAHVVRLAGELEFKTEFPDCDAGAMPPFGNLYGMPVFVDEAIVEQKELAFNAGTHTETLRMRCDDFLRLVRPNVFKFAGSRSAYSSSRYMEDRPW